MPVDDAKHTQPSTIHQIQQTRTAKPQAKTESRKIAPATFNVPSTLAANREELKSDDDLMSLSVADIMSDIKSELSDGDPMKPGNLMQSVASHNLPQTIL